MSHLEPHTDHAGTGPTSPDDSPVRRARVDAMAFAPRWTFGRLGPRTDGPDGPRTFLVPPGQHRLHHDLAQQFPGERVLRLDAGTLAELGADPQASGHLVLVSRTTWSDGVPDEDIAAFLRLVHALDGRSRVSLDVFTDKAVGSPLFASAAHPVDGVYVGLAQTLANERPDWSVRCFCLQDLDAAALSRTLGLALPTVPGKPVCLRGEEYGVATMEPVELGGWPARSAFRRNGTYVVIGGTGGLGGVLAEYLAAVHRAELVVIGRRPAEAVAWSLEGLRDLGASAVHYHQVDLTDGPALERALAGHETIHGVVHSALVLEDSVLATMTESVLFDVLRPKLHGTRNLLKALRGRDIDFCLFFSSVQSYIANAGQANYTAACVAKDAYADLMQNALLINSKVVNWGYWGSIGIVAKPHYRERMEKLGIGSIEAAEGLAVIERLLAGDHRQITVVKGTREALERMGITPHEPAATLSTAGGAGVLDAVVPPSGQDSAATARNRELADALEAYTRWRLHRIPLPGTTIAKYAKLREAIRATPDAQSLPREALLRSCPELEGHIRLLDRCLEHLPDVLRGTADPLDVLFPDGSFELVAPVYRDNPIADHFNRISARVVAAYQRLAAGRALRILEIGAGTGSTTQFVLPQLDPRDVGYLFTDLSYAFLNRARERFADFPFVDYEIRDIEQPPGEDAGSFDVVVATNVLHATSDVPRTLANVRGLLRDGGILVLSEITARQDYATLTFGLTDGWWLGNDAYRIENSPLLSGDQWRLLMRDAGFGGVKAHGSDEQQVMVALAGPGEDEERRAPAFGAVKAGSGDGVLGRVEGFVREVIAETMRFEVAEVERDRPFRDMGIDSLISMELLKPLRERVGYVPATVLFEFPTVGRLAGYLVAEHGEAVSATFGEAEAVVQAPPGDGVLGRVEGFVREVIAETMRFEVAEVERDRPFRDMGIDSLISMELLKPLRERVGYVPATVLFEFPTVGRLAGYLVAEHGEAVSAAFGEADARPGTGAPGTEPTPAVPAVTAHTPAPLTTANGTGHHAETPVFGPGAVAVVGIAARLPQARNTAEFWRNLLDGRDCTSAVPEGRWSGRVTDGPDPLAYTERGAFVDDIDAFDHTFFNLSPHDAAVMDPQERILLEQTYRAILDAGCSRERLAGSDTGVFVGVMNGAYAWHSVTEPGAAPPTSLFWSMANRASYHFDWHGPSMAVDTACSSSLTALHLACQSLRAGECDRAVVGGVNLITHPRQYQLLCGLEMLSRTGECRPFGAGADGFVDGEGVISLVLRPAQDAVRDQDRIYAVIEGSAVNAGGRANGYTAPNIEAQYAVVTKALAGAGITPEDVGYVEAHGTGTELGDPIELRALSKAYAPAGTQRIRLGSVKSNIGHLESAAGLSGVLKALLQMRHGHLVASLHAERTNPHLDLAATPFVLNTVGESWPPSLPRVSAVSSFGAGGANAHVVLRGVTEDAGAPREDRAPRRDRYVIPLSHHSSAGLQQTMDELRHWLSEHRVDMDALAHTLACRRDSHRHRIAIVCRDQDELVRELGVDLERRGRPAAPRRSAAASPEDLAALFEAGGDPDWERHYPRRAPLSLPEYVFLRHRHWVDSAESGFHTLSSLIAAHRINGRTMAPAAWTLSVLAGQAKGAPVGNVLWHSGITAPENVEVRESGAEFSLVDRRSGEVHCTAELMRPGPVAAVTDRVPAGTRRQESPEIYDTFRRLGYDYGGPLRGVRWAEVGPGAVRAFLQVDQDWGYDLSPALLDCGMQLSILLSAQEGPGAPVFVPYHLGRLTVVRIPRNEAVYCHCVARTASRSHHTRTFDFFFTDTDGEVVVVLEEAVSVAIGDRTGPGGRAAPAPRPPSFTLFELN